MAWEVEFTDEFNQWWNTLTVQEQRAISPKISRLMFYGAELSSPHSKPLKNSRNKLYELRVQNRGRPLRILYAFDPRQTAVILIGGNKTGDSRFYRRYVTIANDIFDEFIARLEREGLI
jgi:hypothetical protein